MKYKIFHKVICVCALRKRFDRIIYAKRQRRNEVDMGEIFHEEMRHLNYLLGETNAVYHEAAVRFGVSDSTMQVLYTICMKGGERCQLSDITRLTGSSRQTIHSAVRKLEQEGVVRLEAKNGRNKFVCLTGQGQELMERTALRLIGLENDIIRGWTAQDRQEYLRLTQKYLTDLKQGVAGLEANGKENKEDPCGKSF